jgi:HSP20 family protein
MSIIRYQAPQWTSWPALDRWSGLRDDLNALFELPFWGGAERQGQLLNGWSPALDLYQNNDNLVTQVELPGMRKEDIEISLHDGTLTISGERKIESPRSENGEKAERSERYFGRFRRSIALPVHVDGGKVSASYRDGILTVTLPKAEEAKPRQIQITAN